MGNYILLYWVIYNISSLSLFPFLKNNFLTACSTAMCISQVLCEGFTVHLLLIVIFSFLFFFSFVLVLLSSFFKWFIAKVSVVRRHNTGSFEFCDFYNKTNKPKSSDNC